MIVLGGAARGLGMATAQRFHARGWRVWIANRSRPAGKPAWLEPFEPRFAALDLTLPEQVELLAERVLALDGRVDALVQAAGEYVRGALETIDAATLARLFQSNVVSTLNMVNAFRAPLRARSGAIVCFGNAGQHAPRAYEETAAYAAAKSALLVLVRSWAVEEAPYGVRVNMLSPGHVPHPDAASDTNDPARWSKIPMGRPGTLEEVCDAVEWLCSERARYVTGSNVELGGGYQL